MLTLLLFPLDLTTFFHVSVNYEAMSDIFFRYISHSRRGKQYMNNQDFFPCLLPLFHQMKFIFLLFHLLGSCMQERKKRLLRKLLGCRDPSCKHENPNVTMKWYEWHKWNGWNISIIIEDYIIIENYWNMVEDE